MSRKLVWPVIALCILCGLLVGACTNPSPAVEPAWTEKSTVPVFGMEDIRTAQFSDLSDQDPYYDLACYMLYYKLMDAKDGQFLPNKMLTYADGAEVIRRLTNEEVNTPAEQDAPMTREQLAIWLYESAQSLGYGMEITAQELSYPDADQVQQQTWKAMCWVVGNGLFDHFIGYRLLPNVAVSRIQMAQALVSLKAMDPEDALAAQIRDAMPLRNDDSVALQMHDEIQAAVDKAAKRYGADGLQVAVIENGVVTDTYAYGWATKNKDEMTTDHKIRIASISKVAVGITAQLLREDGIIDLDADISEYWGVTVKNRKYPDYPITIRGMLTHTSSIVNYGDATSREYSKVKAKLTGPGFSGTVPGDIGYWGYNNYAFAVLGMTLELAADRKVDDILGEKLYRPMDIDSAFGSGDLKNTDKLATIYRATGEVGRSVATSKTLHSNETPGGNGVFFAGGMTTSSYDLGKLIALLAGDGMYEGVQLLDKTSVERMEERIDQPVPGGSYQALPMRYWPSLYGRSGIYFHTGSAYGVFNCACYDPETKDGVVVLTSGASGSKDSYGIYKVCAEINQYIYDAIQ